MSAEQTSEYGLEQLPDRERQERLVAGMAHLVRRVGFERLVLSPVVEPDAKYFPDHWSPTRSGVKRLVRRLLAYAGLSQLRVQLDVFDDPTSLPHAAAYFAGISDGVVRFGLERHQIDDRETMVAALCHEVAHAFRAHHGLRASNEDIEEALTDLTTIYLGFGILTTNAAYRYQAMQIGRGHMQAHSRLGYLSPAEMSFLLALQSMARDESDAECRRWAKGLEPTQRFLFLAAREHLAGELDKVDSLGVPPRERWPEWGPDEVGPEEAEPEDRVDLRRRPKVDNAGRPVFRVVHRRTTQLMWMLPMATLPFLFAFGLRQGEAPVILFVAWVLGGLVGRTLRRDYCSDPGCEAPLPLTASECPGCRGSVAGSIDDPSERLAAEEDLALRRKKKRAQSA